MADLCQIIEEYSGWPTSVRLLKMADMCQNIQDGRQVSLSDCSKWLSSVRIFKMANLCQNIQGSQLNVRL